MSRVAIDASALLALLRDEPGAAVTAEHLRRSCLSSVNLSEVLEQVLHKERGVDRVLALLKNWQVEIVAFDAHQAGIAADIKHQIGTANLCFADRACLALARSREIPALTADREWSSLPLDVAVIQIRGAGR